jgi:acyl-CoA synthetase (AMP-forming)/AMP-acid ligase II
MLRGIYGDPERYKETYWSRFPGLYFAGDGAKRDEDGYFWLLGRVDDVMNVSGHRISTTEVESALVDHQDVAEAAVIGKVDERTGQQIVAFVTLKGNVEAADDTTEVLREHVARKIGSWPGRPPSSSPPTCPRPGRARSCGGCSRTSPRSASSATSPRSPTPPSSRRSATRLQLDRRRSEPGHSHDRV